MLTTLASPTKEIGVPAHHLGMERPRPGAELEEIETVYKRDLTKFQRLATAIVGAREAGCDAVQDAFARAVRRRAEFRGEGTLEGWLWRIVVSVARDAAAQTRATASLDDTADGEVHALDPGERSAYREVIARLPERQRLAIFLRYYADLDYGAIADALDISPGTVGATLTQARETLRQSLMEVAR